MMTVKESKSSWILKCVLAFAITFAVFALKFPQFVSHPNNQTFFSNGDLLITLYDMIYHVRYDSDGTFTGMNYPDGEYLFMTDANGSFATVMRWVDQHLLDIDQYIPGILMTLIYLLLGVCGMFIFMILRTTGISTILAFLLAPLITFLSPQMVRIACHLSLSFPFVLPMVMLWALRKYKAPAFEWWDLAFLGTTFFFFMNNAYIGFIMCMFLGLIGFFLFLKGREDLQLKRSAIMIMGAPVLITIIVYILLKLNDPYDDRLEEQWGFFYYHTKFYSLFFPKWSLLASWIPKYQSGDMRSIEWSNNLGLVPIGLFLSYFIYSIRRRYNKTLEPLLQKSIIIESMGWAAFAMFLFAANTTIFPVKNLVESYMDTLLMFKASGRFSWPLYFFVALFAARILQAWMHRLEQRKKYASYFLLVPILLFYAYETNHYLDSRFGDRDRKNFLTSPEIDPVQKAMDSLKIDTSHYQAMNVLPLFVGWNEKINAKVHNRSEQGALQVSVTTGIPMINGRLSRNSTSKTLLATQMSSHPLLKKEAIQNLPNQKPILLVKGDPLEDGWLSFGELEFLALGEELYAHPKYKVYEVSLEAIEGAHQKWRKAAIDYYEHVRQNDSLVTKPLVLQSYDDTLTKQQLFGSGAFQLEAGQQKIVDYRHEFKDADTLTFYTWVEITSEKYGMPEFKVTVKGENDFYYYKHFASRESKDIYKNWIRAEHTFAVPKGNNWIEVIAKGNQKFWIDEVTIASKNDTTIHPYPKEKFFLYDGYPVALQD